MDCYETMISPPENTSSENSARLAHPLMGSNPSNLFRLLWENGPVERSRIPHSMLAMAGSIARWPLSLAERLRVSLTRSQNGSMPPPIFIVGHWRSGTTHVYNVLSKSPDFGFPSPYATGAPWDFILLTQFFSSWISKALPSNRFIDRVPVKPDSPQEDETAMANMGTLSFYHGLYFPEQFQKHFQRGIFLDNCSEETVSRWEENFTYFIDKLYLQQGKRILVKNPVYTARVNRLRSLYPDAHFIHVYRNPYRVYESMRHFYPAMFQELALQDYSEVKIKETTLDTYPRMMSRLYRHTNDLPENQFAEIRFEEFEKDPLKEIERIYDRFDLDGFESHRSDYEEYLQSVADYQKNRYPFPDESLELVEKRWGEWLNRLNYSRPDEAE